MKILFCIFKNYFGIAFRNRAPNKVFSAINIFGLAIGIANCLIILLFVLNEFRFPSALVH